MGGIYEVRRLDGLGCHDTHTKFHKDWFRHSEANKWDLETHGQHSDPISLLLSLKNKGSRLRMVIGEIGWSGMDWTGLARDRDQWRAVVNTVMNFRVPQNVGKFMSS
jgi:hypothetical protein